MEEAKLKLQVWQEEYKRSIKKKLGLPVRPENPPPTPGERMLLITDATPEKLQEILVANPAGVLVVRDELTQVRHGMVEKTPNPCRMSSGNSWVYTTFAIELETLR